MLRAWSKKTVLDLLKKRFSDYSFVVASNRQPYVHKLFRGKIECSRGPGGVITALDPIMRELKGTWVCCSSGDGDKLVAKNAKVKVPPENPSYDLRYIWLSKEENLGYYYGYSNQGLWPLSHLVFVQPDFSNEHWKIYKQVNKKFAQNINKEIKGKKAIVFVQDYHLALVSKYLKEINPEAITLMFWHIPWPTYDVFRILPQKQELLDGLLSYDMIGFHINYFCNNFFDAVANEIEAKINKERQLVVYKGRKSLVRAYPISVDFDGINKTAQSPKVEELAKSLYEEFGLKNYKVVVGLDRIDYTKGIVERIQAVDKLLDKYPELKEKMVFIQMGEISRIHLSQYKQLNETVNALVEEVNFKHSQNSWKPIVFLRRHLNFEEVVAFYKIADTCIVTSLHDGMNLVAKEFVSAKADDKGALVLSRFTGASRELREAFLVNPYNTEETSEAIYKALTLNDLARKKRMRKLRQIVQRNDIWKWIGQIVSEIPQEE
ncbi:MAG: trehalose-6-phosphate synthase [Candidatus Omnitrophica bacterium]|nr:trehalose-6-phosphate synthase [Candidatus Omnitrophota bacterium]